MDKKLIVANWKNHPDTLAEAEGILEFTNDYLESLSEKKEFSLVFCPPFIFLKDVARLLKMSHLEHDASLGAQDIAVEDSGEISGPMLNKLGVSYVIIGHSERRWKIGESDEVVNCKLRVALRNELVPIVCIGEKTRDGNFKKFLEDQLDSTFRDLSSDEVGKCIIAYEPVWAISTNTGAKPDTPPSALESIHIIKDFLTLNFKLLTFNFLYGGSVNPKNVGDFLKEKEINGVLIGGASVNKQEFVKILEISSQI
ncbi:MAG: triose-phosphate isomerase [bacterium]|nr:triose-phosphate isomerase [bacterium]